MDINGINQILGILASIVAILAFFGIAHFVDLKKIFPGSFSSSSDLASPTVANAPGLPKVGSRFAGVIAGGIGGVLTGVIYNGAFQSIFYPWLPVNNIIEGAVVTGLIWATCVTIGSAAKNANDGVTRAAITGGLITAIMAIIRAPYFDAGMFVNYMINGIIVGTVSSLIGGTRSVINGLIMGAIGGAITGVTYGVFFGPSGIVVGLFIGVVAAGLGGALTSTIMYQSRQTL